MTTCRRKKLKRTEQAEDQFHYDRLKAIDVQWWWFVIIYAIFMVSMAIGAVVSHRTFKVSGHFLVWSGIIFFLVESVVLIVIFFFAVKQEEV